MWSILARELRVTLRGLVKSRGFTSLAVATIAIVICGVTLIASIISGALLDPGPYRAPSRVVGVQMTASSLPYGRLYFPYDDVVAAARATTGPAGVFEDVAAQGVGYVMMTGGREPVDLIAGVTDGEVFARLGVLPLLGRGLMASDDRVGAPAVVVLAEETWEQTFGRDPAAIGRMVRIDDRPHEIVGVMPRRFTWGVFNAWLPLRPDLYAAPLAAGVQMIGWLRDDATERRAEAALQGAFRALAAAQPDRYPARFGVTFHHPAEPGVRDDLRQTLWLLLAAVSLLAVVGVVNVAALGLARAVSRVKELGIRVAMGASRAQIARLQLMEAGAIAGAGAVGGIGLAALLLPVMLASLPQGVLPLGAVVSVDWRVLVAITLATTGMALTCGAIPAWLVTRLNLERLLRQGARGTSSTGGLTSAWRALVGIEVAMAMALLALTGVFGRSLLALQAEPLQYSPDRVVLLNVTLPEARYPTLPEGARFLQQVLERYRALPGVESASLGYPGGPRGVLRSGLALAGRPPRDGEQTGLRIVGADYFETYRIPTLYGRTIDRADEATGRRVAVVNEAFVRTYLGGRSPIGRQVQLASVRAMEGAGGRGEPPFFEIVGVVANVPIVQTGQLERRLEPEVAVPFTSAAFGRHRYFVVRTRDDDPLTMSRPLQEALWEIDRDQAFRSIRTEADMLWVARFGWPRFRARLIALFGGVSLALVAAGVYGILSYMTARSTREIGIRLALGASPGLVIRQSAGVGLRPALIGLIAGAGAAAVAGTLVRSFVSNVSPWDAVAYLAAAGILLAVVGLAAYVPARRAASLGPVAALRAD